MRWLELRNSCKGVGEEQAIGYFTDGCREGTLMKHKLHRAEPKTTAEFMAIADKCVSADPAARVQYVESVPAAGQSQPASGQSGHHNHDRHGKRKDDITTTSMAPSKWPLFKEARGLRAEVRSTRETSSTRTSAPSR
jgi:hypothetical protein